MSSSTKQSLPDGPAADVTRFVRQRANKFAGALEPAQPLADGMGARYYLEEPEGSGFREFIRVADDMYAILVDTTSRSDWFTKFVEEDFLTFHYRLSGSTRESFEEHGSFEPGGPFCGVDLHPAGLAKAVWVPSGTHFRAVSIKVKPSFVIRTIGEVPSWLPEPQIAYLKGTPAEFFSLHLELTPLMKRIASELLGCTFRGSLRRAYAEAKAIELVCITLDAMARQPDLKKLPVRLLERDIARLRDAHEILTRQFSNPPSFPRLARQVGINRNKLAYGFKHIFGVTTTQFLQLQRMDRALELLKSGRYTVSQVSEEVGYHDPGGFAKLFKKHFGVLPKDVPRQDRSLSSGRVEKS
jgi:AraC-like DNA-binding protein